MSKLTIHFTDPTVEPIVVEGCEAEFADEHVNTTYALPAEDSQHEAIAQSAVKASDGQLHYEFSDSLDAYLFFDTRTNEFRIWQGDGDNKSRGYFLDTAHPLPGVERIDVEAEDED